MGYYISGISQMCTMYIFGISQVYHRYISGIFRVYLKYIDIQGVSKKTPEFFCITRIVVTCKPCNGNTNCFSLLKTEIHLWMLNTEPFLCHIRGLRYLKTKYCCEIDKFDLILANSCTCSLRVASGYPKRSQTGPWLIKRNPNWP